MSPKQLFTALLSLIFWLASSLSVRADNLAEIYELALENDPVLRGAEATYKAGSEASRQGLSGLLPQVVASGEYQEVDVEKEGLETTRIGDGSLLQFPATSETGT